MQLFVLVQGHNGSIKVNRNSQRISDDNEVDTSTLEIRVLIDGSKEKGKVKDLKQLSGRQTKSYLIICQTHTCKVRTNVEGSFQASLSGHAAAHGLLAYK